MGINGRHTYGRTEDETGKNVLRKCGLFPVGFLGGDGFFPAFPGVGGTLIHVSAGAPAIAAAEVYTSGTYDNITVFIAGAAAMTLAGAVH